MMKRILFALCGALLIVRGVYAEDSGSSQPQLPKPRISIFSTTTDWQALTGMLLNEYRGVFKTDSKTIGNKGLVFTEPAAFRKKCAQNGRDAGKGAVGKTRK